MIRLRVTFFLAVLSFLTNAADVRELLETLVVMRKAHETNGTFSKL